MRELRPSQFTVRRLFIAMVWVSISGLCFRLLQEVHEPRVLEWALAVGTIGAFGVGLGSVFRRPLAGGFLTLTIRAACAVFG
jgi:hypothetical protein